MPGPRIQGSHNPSCLDIHRLTPVATSKLSYRDSVTPNNNAHQTLSVKESTVVGAYSLGFARETGKLPNQPIQRTPVEQYLMVARQMQ